MPETPETPKPPKDVEPPSGRDTKFLCVGEITGVHGVRGAVRLKSFTEQAEDIVAYGPLYDEAGERVFRLRIESRAFAKKGGGILRATIEGITDRGKAEALKGLKLYLPRAALPETGEEVFYHADLIGLEARQTSGERLGRVIALHNYGAGDNIEIGIEGKESLVLPFTKKVVPEIDLKGGYLRVEPPENLMEEIKSEPKTGKNPGQKGKKAVKSGKIAKNEPGNGKKA